MAIDNTEKIRPLLKFEKDMSFYFLEIIKRRKENPDLPKHAHLVKDYFINSVEKFDKILPEVRSLCDEHNARAYIRLNVRDYEKIALHFNKRLAELLLAKDYKNVFRSYASVVGEFHHDSNPKWVVDIDWKDEVDSRKVLELIEELPPETNESKLVVALGTKNGIHLITRPFRLDEFKRTFPKVEVHKDATTILYVP